MFKIVIFVVFAAEVITLRARIGKVTIKPPDDPLILLIHTLRSNVQIAF